MLSHENGNNKTTVSQMKHFLEGIVMSHSLHNIQNPISIEDNEMVNKENLKQDIINSEDTSLSIADNGDSTNNLYYSSYIGNEVLHNYKHEQLEDQVLHLYDTVTSHPLFYRVLSKDAFHVLVAEVTRLTLVINTTSATPEQGESVEPQEQIVDFIPSLNSELMSAVTKLDQQLEIVEPVIHNVTSAMQIMMADDNIDKDDVMDLIHEIIPAPVENNLTKIRDASPTNVEFTTIANEDISDEVVSTSSKDQHVSPNNLDHTTIANEDISGEVVDHTTIANKDISDEIVSTSTTPATSTNQNISSENTKNNPTSNLTKLSLSEFNNATIVENDNTYSKNISVPKEENKVVNLSSEADSLNNSSSSSLNSNKNLDLHMLDILKLKPGSVYLDPYDPMSYLLALKSVYNQSNHVNNKHSVNESSLFTKPSEIIINSYLDDDKQGIPNNQVIDIIEVPNDMPASIMSPGQFIESPLIPNDEKIVPTVINNEEIFSENYVTEEIPSTTENENTNSNSSQPVKEIQFENNDTDAILVVTQNPN
ncbi:unnamed protein product, partial [Meganyctiphanes norvegica]